MGPKRRATSGPNKTYEPLLRWQYKRNFSSDEDEKIKSLISEYGEKNWETIAGFLPGRTPRSVKERWNTYLRPNVNRNPFTHEEDLLLIQKYEELGPKWVEISRFFVGRTDNSLKNRWYNHLIKHPEILDEQVSTGVSDEIQKENIEFIEPVDYYEFDLDWYSIV